MASDLHGGYPTRLTYTGPTNLTMNNVVSVSPNSAIEENLQIPSGGLYPLHRSLAKGEPVCKIVTHDIGDVLDVCLATNHFSKYFNLGGVVQYQKRALGGTFSGAAANVTLSNSYGIFAVVSEIAASRNDKMGAKLTLDAHFLSDYGYNDPVTANVGQSLVGTPAVGEIYVLGPCECQGLTGGQGLIGLESISIKPGHNIATQMGVYFPFHKSIESANPVIEFKVECLAQLLAVTGPTMFKTTTTWLFWLERKVIGGGSSAFGTAEHIKFTVPSGSVVEVTSVDVDQRGNASVSCKLGSITQLLYTADTTIALTA